MTSRLFWIFSFVLLLAVFHLALALFLPRLTVGELVTELELETKPQRFAVINNKTERLLQVDGDRSLVHAVCMFDVSKRPVEISMALPSDYWSITIYRPDGNAIYTINDREFAEENLRLVVKKQITEDSEAQSSEFADIDSALQVKLEGEHRAFAVLRAFAAYPSHRNRLETLLEKGKCTPV